MKPFKLHLPEAYEPGLEDVLPDLDPDTFRALGVEPAPLEPEEAP